MSDTDPTWPVAGKIKCKWCGGTGMQTRDDLAEHPDDVGRMHACVVCKGVETVETRMTDDEYRAIAGGCLCASQHGEGDVKRTIDDNWWTEIRWRVCLQLLIWGVKAAPAGDAKGALIDAHLAWADECKRQWWKRYPTSNVKKPT